MKKFAVVGCIFFLLFVVAPVMAEVSSPAQNDGSAVEEEMILGENADDVQVDDWRNFGRVISITRVGGRTTILTASGTRFITSSLRKTNIAALCMREGIVFWAWITSANRFTNVSAIG